MPPPTLLVSDDEPQIGTALRRLLGLRGVDVVVDTTSDVVELATELRPKVILLDLLQRRDGLSLLQELKARPDTWGIPTILMSAVVEPGVEDSVTIGARALGALAVVSKPLTDAVLEQVVALLHPAKVEPEADL